MQLLHLLHLLVLPLLLLSGITAGQGSDSRAANVRTSGSSSDIQSCGSSAGGDASAVYLPTGALQNQFLTATGTDPDSIVAVTSSYSSLEEHSPGLASVVDPSTNVFASILIVPGFANDSAATMEAKINHFESSSAEELSGRTQLMYNCTSAANLWNFLVDPNALSLEEFRRLDESAGGVTNTSNNTEAPRKIVAIASVRFADCSLVQDDSIGRPVLGNLFFGSGYIASAENFYTINTTVQNGTTTNTSAEGCTLRLEMARATLTEVYPDCKIKFHSNDLRNMMSMESASESSTSDQTRRRLDNEDSFGFVKHPSCLFECGAEGLDVDQCYAPDMHGKVVALQCKVQFYARNSECDFECGNKAGIPYFKDALAPNKCYDCYVRVWPWPCATDYNGTSALGCCRSLTCPAIVDTTVKSSPSLSWNLADDEQTVIERVLSLYESGDCSNPDDLSSNCCRITCSDCFVNISIVSLYADVDTYIETLDYSTASEMKLTGNSEVKVKVFAPNGCNIEERENMFAVTSKIKLATGIDIEIEVALDILKKLRLEPHGSSAEFGAKTEILGLAGSVDSELFSDLELLSKASRDLGQNGIFIDAEVDAIPTVRASLSLLGGTAKIGVKTSFMMFLELEARVEFPDPYPGLQSRYLDESSVYHGGDCSLPHFMEYKGYAGYGDVVTSMPMSLGIPYIVSKNWEPVLKSSTNRTRTSIFSGCIASAYDAEIILASALNAINHLSDDKQTALKKIIMWALKMPEIDPIFISVTSIDATTGAISIRITVPPSVADTYPTSPQLENEFYERARTESFANTVSSYVGMSLASQCQTGWWGSTCSDPCASSKCTTGSVSCNAVDGSALSCDSCQEGYWGPTCEGWCDIPGNCKSSRCDHDSEAATACLSCDEGWEGDWCETASATTPSSTTAAYTGAGTGWSAAASRSASGKSTFLLIATITFGLVQLL